MNQEWTRLTEPVPMDKFLGKDRTPDGEMSFVGMALLDVNDETWLVGHVNACGGSREDGDAENVGIVAWRWINY